MIVRPKTQKLICLDCFFSAVEEEVHYTIISNNLFTAGEKIALGASGGKDSTGFKII
jgi:cytoplasmic tRNA 2-thiolation protein 1